MSSTTWLARRRSGPSSAATSRLSRTLSRPNSSSRWNVRARPCLARRAGPIRVTSLPSSTTCPEDGLRRPHTMSKSVLLPAPFGPINPVTWPRSAVTVTPSSARLPPKATVTPLASSDATGQHLPVLRPPVAPQAPPLDRDIRLGGGGLPAAQPGQRRVPQGPQRGDKAVGVAAEPETGQGGQQGDEVGGPRRHLDQRGERPAGHGPGEQAVA